MNARTPYPSANPIDNPIANTIDATSGDIWSCSLVAGEWAGALGWPGASAPTRALTPWRRFGSRPGCPLGPHPPHRQRRESQGCAARAGCLRRKQRRYSRLYSAGRPELGQTKRESLLADWGGYPTVPGLGQRTSVPNPARARGGLAAKNKCLADRNKTRTADEATNERLHSGHLHHPVVQIGAASALCRAGAVPITHILRIRRRERTAAHASQ